MIEQFEEIYDKYLEGVQKIAREYKAARKVRDYEKIQEIRDRLAEAEILLSPDIVTEAGDYWKAMELDRKDCEAVAIQEFRKMVGKSDQYKYSTAAEAEAAAHLACQDARTIEREAEKNYKAIRELEGKVSNLVNSIASRLRGSEKY